jgi:NitT/TauT family transport system substrate-binding protein
MVGVTVRIPGFRCSAAVGAAVTLAVLAFAAGCSPAAATQKAAPEMANIKVDVFPTIDFAGLYIAQLDGLFRQQGLTVKIEFAPLSQLAVTSVVNGAADISGTDYVTYIDDELSDNAKLRIIGEASSLEPHDVELLVGAHSKVTSLDELKGRTVGVTSADDINTLLLRALLAENAISASSVNIQFGFQLQNVAQQLSAGQAIAASVPEPFASEGEQQYGLQELADVDQGVTTNFPLEGYAVTQAWAKKYPKTLAAFDRALDEGQQIADTDRGAFEKAIEKYLGIKPETAAVVNLPDFPLSVNPTQLQRVVDAMVQFGLLPSPDIAFKMTKMTG